MLPRIQPLRLACLHAFATWALALAFVLGYSPLAAAATTAAIAAGTTANGATTTAPPTITVRQATLFSAAGQKTVALPNILADNDFLPNGSLVRYRLNVDLPQVGQAPIGVYVPKVSLSGRLFVNGQLAASCEVGALEDLRCLHQPYLLTVPASLWRQGANTLDFEVYATDRQMNGLAPITIGDPHVLEESFYRWQHFIKSDLLIGLTWLSAILGFLSLSMSFVYHKDRVYLWFGITSVVNALGCLNGFVTEPPVDIQIFNWFVYSIRLISVPLLYITFAAVFKKDNRWVTAGLIAFILLAPLAIWLSGNSQKVAFALYLPFICFIPFMLVVMLRWTIKAPSTIHWVSCVLLPALFTCGLIDWLRLGGRTNFEGIYLVPYAYGIVLLVIWILHIIDVSENRKLEQELRQSESMFRHFFNLPLVGTAITSAEKGWVQVNDQTCEILGYSREELFTKTWAEITHPDDLAEDVRLFNQMLNGQIDSYSMEKRFIRPNGDVVSTILSGGRSRASGADSEYFFIQILDITDRKRYEDALVEANKAAESAKQSLLLANAELKRMTANLVEQSRLQEREQLLQDMHDGFGSQLASIRIMAEQGRINPDQFPNYLREITADLHLIVDTLGQEYITLESALLDMRYRLQRHFNSGTPHLYWNIMLADCVALDQRIILHILRIMQEAFNNAVRHAAPQNIWLSAIFDPAQCRVVASVRDDGSGMPANIRPGRGLSNMQQRAREIGAQLDRIDQHPGTELRLTISFAEAPKSD